MEIRKEIDVKDSLYDLNKMEIECFNSNGVSEIYNPNQVNDEVYILDKNGIEKITVKKNDSIDNIFENGIFFIEEDKKVYIYDNNFNVINSFVLDDVRHFCVDKTNENFAAILKITNDYEKKYLVINKDGKIMADNIDNYELNRGHVICKFNNEDLEKYIDYYGNERFTTNNHSLLIAKNGKKISINKGFMSYNITDNGIICCKKIFGKEKYGLLDDELNEVIECKYDFLDHLYNDYYLFKKNNKYGVIDKNGNVVLNPKYDLIRYYENNDLIIGINDNNYEFHDMKNKLVFSCSYEDIDYIDCGIYDNKSKKIFEYNDKEIYTLYINVEYGSVLTNGIVLYYDDDKNIGLYNYKNNVWITEPIYEYDKDCCDCDKYILLKKNGKYGVINKEGKVLIPFEFDLNDIKFITGNLFNIKNKLANVNNCKLDYKVSLYDDADKLILSKSFDNKNTQEIVYEYFKEKLDKSDNLIDERMRFYDDMLLKYIKRKDRDFKREFKDSKIEEQQDFSILAVPNKKPFIISNNSCNDILSNKEECHLEQEELNDIAEEFAKNNLENVSIKKLMKRDNK